MRHGSQLLIDEDPLQVCPSLAVAIGLNEAIALQQLHYWLKRSTNVRVGRRWVFNNYEEWLKQFPFWSLRTIQRTFIALEKMAVVLADQPNGQDRRKWYSIDYDKLAEYTDKASLNVEARTASDNAIVASSTCQDGIIGHDKLASSTRQVGTLDVPERHDLSKVSETTSETPPEKEMDITARAENVFLDYCQTIKPVKRTEKRLALIKVRLLEGHAEADLHAVWLGCLRDPWPERKLHNDITNLLDSPERIERMIELATIELPQRNANNAINNGRNHSPNQRQNPKSTSPGGVVSGGAAYDPFRDKPVL